ncbi:MAG: hypothetical protein SWH54_00920 [Thermodesulfobacteriota bacterium]|nr:hypothetical protein [Thermodesulfobacteriota bacterium]
MFAFMVFIPIYAIISTPIGCIAGTLSTESESEVKEAEALIRKAFSELNINQTIQYQFLRIAKEKTPYNFVVLGNVEFDDIRHKPNYSSFADRGVDTVVWVDISEIGLATRTTSGIDPSLRFVVSCRIELIRAADGEVVYEHIWKIRGDDDEFVDWADNNAKPFREEFNRCIKSVAKQIVEDLFLTKPQKIRLEKEKRSLAYIPKSAKSATPQAQNERSEEERDFTTINLLNHTYHMGDNKISRFENPKPQGTVFEGRFNITDTNLSDVFITVWVSDLVPKKHEQFFRGYYKTKLVVNDYEIAILNNYISGMKYKSEIDKITIGVDKHIVKKGYNEIKIIAGFRWEKNNYDDFQIHKIIVRYK